MAKVVDFGGDFEKEIVKIGEGIQAEKKVSAEESIPEREMVKRSVQSLGNESVASKQVQAKTQSDEDMALPTYMGGDNSSTAIKTEVERLITLAFSESLEKAVREAKKKPYFIEDAFHDALVDKLLPELKKRGLI